MKKIIAIAICVLGFASCGSTARCGLAQTKKIEKKTQEVNKMDIEILEASAE